MENFKYDYGEKVDIIFMDKGVVEEGTIKSLRGKKIIIEIQGEDRLYDSDSTSILKQWKIGQSFKIYNRVDFKCSLTRRFEEGYIYNIQNEGILINSRYGSELIPNSEIEKRITEVGKYSSLSKKYDNLSNQEIRHIFINKNFLANNDKVLSYYDDNYNKSNFKTCEVAPDGNCLYRAFAHQIYGDENQYQIIKNCILDYIEIKKDFFGNFILGGVENLNIYINIKRKDGIWGDDIEIQAFSEIYKKFVHIYNYEFKLIKTFHENTNEFNRDIYTENVFLLYHNEHYDSLINSDSFSLILKTEPGVYEKNIIQSLTESNQDLNYIENQSIKVVVEMGFTLEEATLAFTYAGSDVDLMLQYIYSLQYK
jgi:hypothetical protein